jgi:hypothetical protein
MKSRNTRGGCREKQYDFTKSVKNPYLSKAKKHLTIRLDEDTIQYLKAHARQNGIPCKNLINLSCVGARSRTKRSGWHGCPSAGGFDA